MATWMNEYEIDEAVDMIANYAPEFHPYAKFLADWRDTINDNSDGWPHMIRRCGAGKLMELITQTKNSIRGHGEYPTEQEFRKSLGPIKRAATNLKMPAPELGQPSQGMRM